MVVNAIIVLVVLEAGTFVLAMLLHLGASPFGLRDTYGVAEGIVQGTIGLLLAICAYGLCKRTTWARTAALIVHGIGMAGALFGALVAIRLGEPPDLDPYDLARLAVLVAVPILLFVPTARSGLQPCDIRREPR